MPFERWIFVIISISLSLPPSLELFAVSELSTPINYAFNEYATKFRAFRKIKSIKFRLSQFFFRAVLFIMSINNDGRVYSAGRVHPVIWHLDALHNKLTPNDARRHQKFTLTE